MRAFTIDTENNIAAFATKEQAMASGAEAVITGQKQFETLAGIWPGARLVEIWNSLTGEIPVKKFKDRATAATRIWTAIQKLEVAEPEAPAAIEPKPAKAPRKARKSEAATTNGSVNKKEQVLALMRRPQGATLEEITGLTGWQNHTVRGFMAGTLKKAGFTVASAKVDGARVYSLAGEAK